MGNSKPIRVCKEFLEDIWEKIREQEAKKYNCELSDVKDPQISRVLRRRILEAGGLMSM